MNLPLLTPQAMNLSDEKVFKVEGLNLNFKKTKIFQNLNTSFVKNGINCIIGPSGSGKSSLLFCLNQLIREQSGDVSGKIIFEDENILDSTIDLIKLRRKVGMVFQRVQLFPFSIKKNFCIPLSEHGIKHKEEQQEKIKNSLTKVGLWNEVKDRLDDLPCHFSGGQLQRLCIARVLSLSPQVMLLDELCSSLDPISTCLIEELLVELKKDISIILVTHNINQAKKLADDVKLFWSKNDCSEIIEEGPSLFQSPQEKLTKCYLENGY